MAFPIAAFLAAQGGAAVVGGIANYLANKSAADRAEMLQNKAFQEWMKVSIPDPKEQQLILEQFVVQGSLSPKLEQAIAANPSAFEKILGDSELRGAQNRALSELERVGLNGGLRLSDKAALQEAELASNTQARGNRQAILAEQARRGMGSTGFDVAAKLHGQQTEADRNARSGLAVAGRASDRALEAILGAGELAGKYRAQDFGEKAAKARASDAIDLFNTQNLQNVQTRNVGSLNRSGELNLAQRQKSADQNVALKNYEHEHNQGLKQQQFENRAKIAAGKTGQYNNQANLALKAGENAGNFYSNLATGVSGAAGTGAKYGLMDDYLKNQSGKEIPEEAFNRRRRAIV